MTGRQMTRTTRTTTNGQTRPRPRNADRPQSGGSDLAGSDAGYLSDLDWNDMNEETPLLQGYDARPDGYDGQLFTKGQMRAHAERSINAFLKRSGKWLTDRAQRDAEIIDAVDAAVAEAAAFDRAEIARLKSMLAESIDEACDCETEIHADGIEETRCSCRQMMRSVEAKDKEIASLTAERDNFKRLLRAVAAVKVGSKDAPGHSHWKAGHWDEDGTPCAWCAIWAEVKAAITEGESA